VEAIPLELLSNLKYWKLFELYGTVVWNLKYLLGTTSSSTVVGSYN